MTRLTSTLAIAAAISLTGCGMTPEQFNALGAGDKAVCFHARCDSIACGGAWSTTTVGAAATDGRAPAVNERCEVNTHTPRAAK